jgi:hypothetical protein
MHRHGATR